MPEASLEARTAATTPDQGCRGLFDDSGRAEATFFGSFRGSGGERWCEALAMDVHRHRVHTDRVRDQVQQLPAGTDRMGSSEPERVVEVPVDALRIVATLVEGLEVRIARWDLTDVLDPADLLDPFARLAVACFRLPDATLSQSIDNQPRPCISRR